MGSRYLQPVGLWSSMAYLKGLWPHRKAHMLSADLNSTSISPPGKHLEGAANWRGLLGREAGQDAGRGAVSSALSQPGPGQELVG